MIFCCLQIKVSSAVVFNKNEREEVLIGVFDNGVCKSMVKYLDQRNPIQIAIMERNIVMIKGDFMHYNYTKGVEQQQQRPSPELLRYKNNSKQYHDSTTRLGLPRSRTRRR
jgi:hypothetical protein